LFNVAEDDDDTAVRRMKTANGWALIGFVGINYLANILAVSTDSIKNFIKAIVYTYKYIKFLRDDYQMKLRK
jgi:hypothetical protein